MADQLVWTQRLAQVILAAVPAAELTEQWGPLPNTTADVSDRALDRLRDNLMSWSQCDEQVRRWIVKAWRTTHPDVVTAADQAIIEGFTADACRELGHFPPQDVLLAILTDEVDDGCALARMFVAGLTHAAQRRVLSVLLDGLLDEANEPASQRPRLVIIGGHPRDESVVGERIFADSPFQVRWKAFEKRPSSGRVQRDVISVLRAADALLVITGMASHTLAQFARDFAARNGIPCRCVEKATERQMKAALKDMFPGLTAAWA